MNELLRLANALIYSTEHGGYSETYVDIDDAIKVIKGYQDLLHRIVDVWEDDSDDTSFEGRFLGIIDEIEQSIPWDGHEDE